MKKRVLYVLASLIGLFMMTFADSLITWSCGLALFVGGIAYFAESFNKMVSVVDS